MLKLMSTSNNNGDELKSISPPDEPEQIINLLDSCSEGIVIVVKDGNISTSHKLKPQDGVLNAYLTSLLAQLLKIAKEQNSKCAITESNPEFCPHEPA